MKNDDYGLSNSQKHESAQRIKPDTISPKGTVHKVLKDVYPPEKVQKLLFGDIDDDQ